MKPWDLQPIILQVGGEIAAANHVHQVLRDRLVHSGGQKGSPRINASSFCLTRGGKSLSARVWRTILEKRCVIVYGQMSRSQIRSEVQVKVLLGVAIFYSSVILHLNPFKIN